MIGINVLKKMLHKELGKSKYLEYAAYIKNNIRESKRDTTEIFNDIYVTLCEKKAEELAQAQEHLNQSMFEVFKIGKNYLGAFFIYIAAFALLAEYTIQMVAVPCMVLLSALFLMKTYEFLVNKFCYVDARMVLIFRAALERALRDRKRKEKLVE